MSEKIKDWFAQKAKPGNTAEFGLNIEGVIEVRDKDGNLKSMNKIEKKKFF